MSDIRASLYVEWYNLVQKERLLLQGEGEGAFAGVGVLEKRRNEIQTQEERWPSSQCKRVW